MPTPLVMALIDPFNADACQPFLFRRCEVPGPGRSRGLLRVALDFRRGRNIWAVEDVLLAANRRTTRPGCRVPGRRWIDRRRSDRPHLAYIYVPPRQDSEILSCQCGPRLSENGIAMINQCAPEK